MKQTFKKILLVEDDAIMIVISNKLMSICNFAEVVKTVHNGHQAREYLKSEVAKGIENLPDLIFLDLHMSVMTGWEFLHWYKDWVLNFEKFSPVYILSSTITEEDLRKSKQYKEVKEFLQKPITLEDLNRIKENFSSLPI